MLRRVAKPLVLIMIITFLWLDFSVRAANAVMVRTDTFRDTVQENQEPRDRLERFLQRQDVQFALSEQGIDPAEARARVGALTDGEVSRISGLLDRLPAGGDAVGAIVGAAVLIFIVLLITDILGFTDVFSFVNHPRR